VMSREYVTATTEPAQAEPAVSREEPENG
jgi:hypothetical protein